MLLYAKDGHTFTNFLNDIENIEGYDEKLFKKGLIFLERHKTKRSRIQSIFFETCKFVSSKENNEAIDYEDKKKTFYALPPDGNIQKVKGLGEFSREHSLIRQGIYNCLKGKVKTHKGWKFSYREEDLL
ncbi:hypothetical protein BAOM_2942 [Peribacillus asahii]|uniref:Uncharacterized protein n=1 Tax=Peribacillus asahii TaxID=228899 RepID=A0A3Q9RN85_9BACI|nr:hypothetical protein BAOM_2942 [Peribacillus asahii]